MSTAEQTASEAAPRIIKRYSNRKLYDTRDSRYVTLQQIGEMVRNREDVQIIDNKTKEDKTEVTLALILSEDLKNKPRSVPLAALRAMIQERSDRLMSQLREGPLGRFVPTDEDGEGEASGVAETVPPPTIASAPSTPEVETVEGDADDKPQAGPMQRLNELVESSRQSLDQLQARVDESIRSIPGVALVHELRASISALEKRVEVLEKALSIQEESPADGEDA